MAQSTKPKNSVDCVWSLADGTGSPVVHTVGLSMADFAWSGPWDGSGLANEPVNYERNGQYFGHGIGARRYATFTCTAHVTELTNSSAGNLFDMIGFKGGYTANVSTTDEYDPYPKLDSTWVFGGAALGDDADTTIVWTDVLISVDSITTSLEGTVASISGICYGTTTGMPGAQWS